MNRGGNMISIFSVLSCLYFLANASKINNISNGDSGNVFPSDFSFGVATAAYQIEGGWNADGKGPSIWDTFTHQYPELIADGSNGDVGPNSYELFDLDLQALKELSVHFYRFSIAWTRILPKGDVSYVNQHGINYYNNVINKLVKNGIEPIITMYHSDLPEELQKIGGFANPLIVKYFEEYANILFLHFGDRVKKWITINEPYNFCVPGYGKDYFPPRMNASGIGEYLCVDHSIKAHALAYRLYKRKYFDHQAGKVGITLSSRYFYPKDNSTDTAERALEFMLGWAANAIFGKDGNYPDVMVQDVSARSANEGRKWSRLPEMENEWKDIVKGAGDFLGFNYYTSRLVEWGNYPKNSLPSIECDCGLHLSVDDSWRHAKSPWLHYVPEGLGNILRWIRDKYNNIEVMITENGWSDDGQLEDDSRIIYLKSHLKEVLGAVQDGCNISGYTYWSLIDNFEWRQGFTEKFGLYAVNLKSPSKYRIPKKSAKVYEQIITSRRIPQ